MSARAKCRRKHEYIVIAFKTFLYELRKIAVLRSGNRYRNAERLQPRQKHEKGVHKILQFFAVTVDKHRANILEKTGCKNTASLVVYAIRKGIVEI